MPGRRHPVFLDCAPAHAVARIGGETLEYEATVSATALYLLKALSENHRAYEEEQFLPCCGFGIFEKSDGSGDVVVLECPNGVDWDMTPQGMPMDTYASMTGAAKAQRLAQARILANASSDPSVRP